MAPAVDEQLVQHLYGTAVETGHWRPALERFCHLLGSCEAALTMTAGGPSMLIMVETTGRVLTPELTARYVQHYGRFDPKLKILAAKVPGYLFNDVRHFDEDFVARDVFYQEYSRQVGTRHTLHMMPERGGGREIYLAVMRSGRAGPYERRPEILFRQASCHFVRALALKEKMDCLRRAGDALDNLDFGIAVVDLFRRVTLLNRAAEQQVAQEGEILVSGGILCARSSAFDRRFKALIDTAFSGCPGGGVLRIPVAGGTSLMLRVAPLPPYSHLATRSSRAALILIGGPKSRLDCAEISALYDLTEAEARVALAIAEGTTLAAIAARYGVKYSTVRTQLLSIMQKMGVHRQADVARVLASEN